MDKATAIAVLESYNVQYRDLGNRLFVPAASCTIEVVDAFLGSPLPTSMQLEGFTVRVTASDAAVVYH